MGGRGLRFRHEVIDPDPPGSQHDVTLIVDVNGNGRNDIVGKPYDPERHIDVWSNET